jgi:hypothetical protein
MNKHKKAHQQHQLARSISKYGWQAHKVEIIHELPNDVDIDTLNTYEILYIDLYKSCGVELLNLTSGGKNCRISEESKKKISEAVRNMSDETRRKRSLGLKGNKNSLGFKHSEETKNTNQDNG